MSSHSIAKMSPKLTMLRCGLELPAIPAWSNRPIVDLQLLQPINLQFPQPYEVLQIQQSIIPDPNNRLSNSRLSAITAKKRLYIHPSIYFTLNIKKLVQINTAKNENASVGGGKDEKTGCVSAKRETYVCFNFFGGDWEYFYFVFRMERNYLVLVMDILAWYCHDITTHS